MVAQEVHVATDRDRIARRSFEVSGHTSHEKLGMQTHNHETAFMPRDPCHFSVQRPKIAHVLIRQGLNAEIIRLRGKSRV